MRLASHQKRRSNSYNSPDSINQIDWHRKTTYKAVFNYYKGMVALRKHHAAFRMPSTAMIQKHLEFMDTADPLLISYQLKNHANGDTWRNIIVILNGSAESKTLKLPAGNWVIAANADVVKEQGIKTITGSVTAGDSCLRFI